MNAREQQPQSEFNRNIDMESSMIPQAAVLSATHVQGGRGNEQHVSTRLVAVPGIDGKGLVVFGKPGGSSGIISENLTDSSSSMTVGMNHSNMQHPAASSSLSEEVGSIPRGVRQQDEAATSQLETMGYYSDWSNSVSLVPGFESSVYDYWDGFF